MPLTVYLSVCLSVFLFTSIYLSLYLGSSRLTKALKSLVQDESEVRAREEMAAQIAQMVINDVTSLTMGKPTFEPDLDDGEEAVESDDDDP